MTTYIVADHEFPSKRLFKEAVKSARRIWFSDQSMSPGAHSGTMNDFIKSGYTFWTVTNGKRSWFAEITVDRSGKVRVK